MSTGLASGGMDGGAARGRSVAIVGGGVVGAATALALAAKGCAVTLFEPDAIGSGTSSGNAGGIVTGAVLPTATPGLLRDIPGYIFDPDGAAVLRPAYFFRILPWLVRFVAAGRLSRVKQIAADLHPLVSRALHAHMTLAELSQAKHLIHPVGWLKVYGTDAGFAKTALERELMTRHGVNFRVLNAEQIAELEPQLDKSVYKHGIFQPDSGFVNFPTALSQAYFEAACQRGARQIKEAVVDIRPEPAGGVRIKTPQRDERFDAVVVAAGAWSGRLAKRLGDAVSLDTERGYHLSFRASGAPLLNRPVSFPQNNCVLSPMHDGISMASGDELAGLEAPPDFSRIRRLIPFARRALPGLAQDEVQREWMGYRPSTPDSMPVIGRSPRCADVFYAFGHGHLGLTLSALTAQLVSGMVTGEQAPFDTTPYRINRF